jgi:uncharacterized protein
MRTIAVTGQGSASVVPDRAVVRVSAVHRAAGLAEALSGAESARAAIVAAAGDLIVSSAGLDIWPVHDQEGRAAGFEARHSLTVTGADLDRAGALIDRLAAEVGDRLTVDGVSLTVSDPSAVVREAREAAYADAPARAEHLALLADATLGAVQQVAEGAGPAQPIAGGLEFAAAKADVGLQPGQQTVTDEVTVTWALA